jgi:antitoxin HicB
MIGYRIMLAPDDNGTVLVTCPAPPEVTILGEDEADALRRARLFRLDPASRLEQL